MSALQLLVFWLTSGIVGGALGSRQLLQTDGNAPSPQSAPLQKGITFMVYFSSAHVNVTDPMLAGSGSIILTLGDSPQADNNATTALSYRELRFYPGSAVPVFSGKHVHSRAKGPFIQYFIDSGVGSVPLDLRSYLTLMTNPAAYFVQLHSNSVPATPTNPFRAWADGAFPSLVITVPLTDPAGSGLAGNASLSFQDDAVCLYNLNLPFSVPPGQLEVDILDAGAPSPLLIFNLNTGNTTGVCIPAEQEQVDTITSNLQLFRLSIPQQPGLVSTALTGALDSSVHVVPLYGAAASASDVTSSPALGQLKLTSLSPASLCYFDLQLSPLVAGNATGISLQRGTGANPASPLLTFLPVPGANVNTSIAGCAVNVSADVMAAYLTGNLTNGTFFNVSTESSPRGALQGQVLPFGALPVPVALPPAPAPAPRLAPAPAPAAAPSLSGPLAAISNQSTVEFMVYLTSANINGSVPFPATGSVILSLPDVIAPTLNLTYRELRLYTGLEQSGSITGIHIHKAGPVYYQLSLALGSGAISVNASDALALLATPDAFFAEIHSDTVPATPASPYHGWTRGYFPKLETVVVLSAPDTGAASGARATVQISFHATAVCAHNVQFTGLSPPATTEVDFINGGQTLPTLSITFPAGTTGHCVPLAPGQMDDITGHMENYRVSIPVSGGGQLTLSGRLDNSVREVGLASSAEQGPTVTNGGIGLVRLVALTPRTLCFWQLQTSPNIGNVTAIHLHQGGPTDNGNVLVPFYPVIPGSKSPLSGCVSNVSAGAMSLYAADPPATYFNVHNLQYPDGVLRGQLPPFGIVPATLPTPGQIRGAAPAATLPPPSSSSGGVSVALIAALVGGGVAILVVALIVVVFLCRRKRRRNALDPTQDLGAPAKDVPHDNGWAWHGPDSERHLPKSPRSGGTGRSSRRSGTPQRHDSHRVPSEPVSMPTSSNLSDDVSREMRPRYWRDAGPEGRSGEEHSEPSSFGRHVAPIRARTADSPVSQRPTGTPKSRSALSGDTSTPFSLDDDIMSLIKLSFADVLEMTNSFQAEDVIGEGGFGVVYRGTLPDGSVVAVKRACREAMRSSREFRTEVKLLSRLHHQNLVQLVAYCLEAKEQILVYKYMANGSLRSWLQQGGANKHRTRLSFTTRLKIALGTANGLNYLHTGASPHVIHRDVKSGNILLDDDFTAKVSDFGLGCIASLNETRGYQSNVVCGTPGYVDPEYYETARVTDKSDVYAFGVVLLEMLTGRSAVPRQADSQHKNLARELRPVLGDPSALHGYLEPLVAEQASPAAIAALASLATRCLAITGTERPTMAEVAHELQDVLRIQEAHRIETGAAPDSPESVASHSTRRGGVLVHSVVQGR